MITIFINTNKENEGLLFVFLPQSVIGHRGITRKLRGLNLILSI